MKAVHRKTYQYVASFLLFNLVMVLVMVLWLRPHIHIYRAASNTMSPVIETGDFVFSISPMLHGPPKLGQVIVYSIENLDDIPQERLMELHVKRIIAFAGDEVELVSGSTVVPPSSFLAMGDQREISWDGRYYGAVPLQNIRSFPQFRIWPPNRIGAIE